MNDKFIVTKQIIRDKLYFLGPSSLNKILTHCNLPHTKENELKVRFYLDSLIGDGVVFSQNGKYATVKNFKLKGF